MKIVEKSRMTSTTIQTDYWYEEERLEKDAKEREDK